jgi:hypothetical protein
VAMLYSEPFRHVCRVPVLNPINQSFDTIPIHGHEESKLQARMTHICTTLNIKPIVNHRHQCLIFRTWTFGIRRD